MKNKLQKVKSLAILLILTAGVWGLSHLAVKATANFTISRITTNLPFNPKWQAQNPTDEPLKIVESILKQKFLFLDNGGQSWVFISEDGQHVVKFFKFSFTWYDLFKKAWLPAFLKPYRPQMTAKQIGKRYRLLGGYALAYEKMREESLLVATFLNGKQEGIHTLHITDKLGIQHRLDLSDKPFVIQRTGVPLVKHLAPLMKEGRVQEAQEALCSALSLIAHRCEKGIKDEDHRLFCNLGFMGKQAVYLDAGALVEDPSVSLPENARGEILHAADLLISQLETETQIFHVPPHAPLP